MKKTVVALAVLAASGAAMAQSSVSIYGIVDAYVGSTKNTIGNANAQSQTLVGDSGLKSSRLGFKGTEDLGGGLKASFKLEQRFKPTSGAQDGVLFKGESSVALSGGFGAVALGRMGTPYDSLHGATNLIGDTNMSTASDVYKTAGLNYTDKLDNVIAYQSPNFNGFSGSAALSLGGNKTATVDATKHVSLEVRYANGPLLVGYGYQKEEAQNGKAEVAPSVANPAGTPAVAATGIDKTTYNLFAASYDFGVAKLVGNYQTAKLDKHVGGKQGDQKSYILGVSAPVASNVNVFFGYSAAKYDAVAANIDIKSTGYTLAANYVLSKRTDLYAGYKTFNKKNDNTGADMGKSKTFAVGVRHTF